MSAIVLVGIGLNVAIVLMFAAWWICRRLDNAGFVDVAWAYGFALLAGLFVLLGAGYGPRKALLLGMVALWSLRLGTHLLARLWRRHPKEDPRYSALREQFPKRVWYMFFGFAQLQAILIGLLSVPFALVAANKAPGLSAVEWGAAALWLVAFVGEAVADFQLERFRNDPSKQGQVCQSGLWRFSRHPNYFFECVIWLAWFLFALGTPWGWVTLYCPLVMIYFLVSATGIPAAEEQALRSRGDAYRGYQRRTSVLIPWFPRSA